MPDVRFELVHQIRIEFVRGGGVAAKQRRAMLGLRSPFLHKLDHKIKRELLTARTVVN